MHVSILCRTGRAGIVFTPSFPLIKLLRVFPAGAPSDTLSHNCRKQAISLRTLVVKATQRHLTLVDVRANHCVLHRRERKHANLQQVRCAGHARIILPAPPSANTPCCESCTTYCSHVLRRKVQISAWQRCPLNPIRKYAEITPSRSRQCTRYISAEKSQATVRAAAEVLACGLAIAQFANPFHH